MTAYLTSPVQIKRDKDETTPGLKGFTRQPEQEATGAGVLEDDSTRADAELDPEQPV